MPDAVHKMGGDNVLTNTLGVLFSDGTLQTTAAAGGTPSQISGGGSSVTASAAGVASVDVFGNKITTESLSGQPAIAMQLAQGAAIALVTISPTTAYVLLDDGDNNGLEIGLTPIIQLTNAANAGLTVDSSSNVKIGPASGPNVTVSPSGCVITGALVFGGVTMPSVAPIAGQVMTATGPTAATWQTPSITFQQVTVTLTSAQLLALSTTPITLVPAPGVGFYVFPTYYTMQYHFGGTAYTSPATTNDCYFLYGNPPEVNPTNLIALYNWAATASGIIKATASCTFIGICGEGLTPYTTVGNAPVTFSAPNALGAGNGTLTITLNYSILPLP